MATGEVTKTGACGADPRAAIVCMAAAIMWGLTAVAARSASAQTLNVVHSFANRQDGAQPETGLTMDSAGNLYGTTQLGGGADNGTVFKLHYSGSAWVLTPIYIFSGGSDGQFPLSRVIFGPDGSLYGATTNGGIGSKDYGLVFKLTPPANVCGGSSCFWNETVLHRFAGGADGAFPLGDLVLDGAGNLFGTASVDGAFNGGTVYKLASGDRTFSVVYAFGSGLNDGLFPTGALAFAPNGRLYGTTESGGTGQLGTVFELTPSGSSWTETSIYSFQNDANGQSPWGGVIADASGSLYGSTLYGGMYGGGTLFKLTRSSGWTFTLLHAFTGYIGPFRAPSMDAGGNLYGTVFEDGADERGSVFELTAEGEFVNFHDFTGGNDGGYPMSSIVLDRDGNLFGTTNIGGANGYGEVFEIRLH